MARQTRAERRARREARERSMAGGGGGNGGELAVAGAGGDGGRPERAPSQAGTGRPAHRNGLIRFIEESVGELRKVEWPGQNQVVQGTVVVIIACVIIGTYLYVCDQVFNKLVSKVLLGQ
jgi:preprotein translocase subunit SecE